MKISTPYHYQNTLNRELWLKQVISTRQYRDWLISEDSLTARLKAHYTAFKVRPLTVKYSEANLDERTCLLLKQKEQALVREVLLYGDGQPVVFAHSVLPKKSLRGDWCALGKLGNRPLGETLFNNPKVQRTPLHFKKLNKHHVLYQKAVQHVDNPPVFLWARRSVFSLNCAKILVTEVFLPSISL